MFDHATSFNQDLSSWDVSNNPGFQLMFENTPAFNQPLDSWDVSLGYTFHVSRCLRYSMLFWLGVGVKAC